MEKKRQTTKTAKFQVNQFISRESMAQMCPLKVVFPLEILGEPLSLFNNSTEWNDLENKMPGVVNSPEQRKY